MRNQTKLELGLRKNQGRLQLANFLRELSVSLGRPENTIKLLDLERTDQYRAQYEEQLRYHRQNHLTVSTIWNEDQMQDMRSMFALLQQRIPTFPLIMFRALSEICGAVETDTSELFERATYLVGLDQEDLMAMQPEGPNGLLLTLSTNRYSPLEVRKEYELTMWGDIFLNAVGDKLTV